MPLSPEAQELAHQWAVRDRDLLARLRKMGLVKRQDGPYELNHPEAAKPFIRDIEQRNKPKINLAIRPHRKRKR